MDFKTAKKLAQPTIDRFEDSLTFEYFDKLWLNVNEISNTLNISKPELPTKRTALRWIFKKIENFTDDLETNLDIYKEIINFDNFLSEINVWQNFRKNDEFNYKIELKEIFILALNVHLHFLYFLQPPNTRYSHLSLPYLLKNPGYATDTAGPYYITSANVWTAENNSISTIIKEIEGQSSDSIGTL
ncbi:hypothetical protein BpHYR1_052201 [Brachionus plicatilis]|uniref:Uncharacterized protein n=1 Tax=Brachionus plicatilis TaxID=10195 RepID=A0A3M7S454_BRAPC|nr:hypothetical protein BpHYR1_052201 [Brachionus plicatilis]